MVTAPRNALALLRLSDLRVSDLDADGNSPSLQDMERRIRACGSSMGWTVGRVIVENDLAPRYGKMRSVSAFKRRKIRLPDGRVEMTLHVADTLEVRRWILGYGVQAEVVEPAGLREALRAEAEALAWGLAPRRLPLARQQRSGSLKARRTTSAGA